MKSFDNFFIAILRLLVKVWLRVCYRLHVIDVKNIPDQGPVMLVGNHFSFLDTLLIYCTCKRKVRFIADDEYLPKKNWLAKYVSRVVDPIRFIPGDRSSTVKMIRRAQESLKNGEVLCIFPEGALTRNGQVRAFKKGFLAILKKTPEVPIVPFGISGFFGSKWSYAKVKGFKTTSPCRPCISYGVPFNYQQAVDEGQSDEQITQRLLHIVQEICVDSYDLKKHPENLWILPPSRSALRGIRKFEKGKLFLVDSTGKEVTSSRALLEILVLRNVFRRILGKETSVGVILPTSASAALVNIALTFNHRIPVNLNYTFTNEVIDHCIHKVGVKKVLTSAQLLKKLPKLKIDADMLVLEDLAKTEIRTSDKLLAVALSCLPTWLLERLLGLNRQKLTDVNTIVFTSGSTGLPKGTILTNSNIVSNCHSFLQSAMPEKEDSIFSALPLFHSFGYTVTSWFVVIHSHRCIYHYNPLDYKMMGEMARKYKPTLTISTPTFLRTYARKCQTEDFASIDFPVAGAEKASKALYDMWEEKFGHELCEGYGATEMAPVLCHTIPSHRAPDNITPYRMDGSVGMPSPGFVAKAIDMETGKEVPPNETGMLIVKGNSITPGYFDDPENTAKIFRDGWYVTGDVVRIDENNFIYITGRESRISKIGGEMAPHILIEERLNDAIKALLADNPSETSQDDNDHFQLVITAVPDEKKGEKLVVLYDSLPFTPEEICKKTSDLDLLPPLWIPATSNFKQVEQIPVLGTGKLDLKGIKKTALEIYQLDSEL